MHAKREEKEEQWFDISKIKKSLEKIIIQEGSKESPLDKQDMPTKTTMKAVLHKEKYRRKKYKLESQLSPLASDASAHDDHYTGTTFTYGNTAGGLPANRREYVAAHCYIERGKFTNNFTDDMGIGRYERLIIELKNFVKGTEGQLIPNPKIELLIAERKGNMLVWRRDQSLTRAGGFLYEDCNPGSVIDTMDITTDAFRNKIGYEGENPNMVAQRASKYSMIFKPPTG